MTRTRCLLFFLVAAGGLAAQHPGFDLNRGLPELQAAAQRDSNDPAVHYDLGLGYWQAERYDDAEGEFRLAMRLDPDFAPPFVGLYAMTYWRLPKMVTERSGLTPELERKLAEVDPMLRHAILTDPLVDLTPLGASLPQYLGRLFPDLRGLYDLFYGKYPEALPELTALIGSVPRGDSVRSDLLMWRGIAALHLGIDTLARSDFQRLADRASARAHANEVVRFPIGSAEYDYLLALTLMRLRRAPEAVKYLHDALVTDAGLYQAHTRLAEIAESGEDWDDAVAERRAAADADPENSQLLMMLGATLVKAGRLPEAEAPLRQAVLDNPRDFRAEFVLGLTELQLGKPAEARAALMAAIALTPSRFPTVRDDARKRLASLTP